MLAANLKTRSNTEKISLVDELSSFLQKFCIYKSCFIKEVTFDAFLVFNLQAAIANAKTLQEMQSLEMMLKTGQVPSKGAALRRPGSQEVEQDEPMEVTNGT